MFPKKDGKIFLKQSHNNKVDIIIILNYILFIKQLKIIKNIYKMKNK